MRLQTFDALLVTDPTNLAYLLGEEVEGLALLRGTRVHGLTDPRYAGFVRGSVRLEVVPRGQLAARLSAVIGRWRVRRLALEAEHVTCAQLTRLRRLLPRGLPTCLTSGVIATRRQIKTPAEIRRHARACGITTASYTAILPRIRLGMTERFVTELIRRAMHERGADGLAFPSIVAFGAGTRLPHAVPGTRRLRAGDTIQCDIGARWRGYCADFSRVAVAGRASPTQQRIHAAVLAAQRVGRHALRAGIPAADVDHASRQSLATAGLAEYFCHATGHGVGRDIHEAPSLSAGQQTRMQAGMVVTVEPGVYMPRVGMRIEDTLVVTPDGNRCLTTCSRALAELRV